MAKQDLAFIGAISHLLKSVTSEASAFLYLPQYIYIYNIEACLWWASLLWRAVDSVSAKAL